MASTKTTKKTSNEPLVYVSTYYGGIMKMSTAYVTVTTTHPEVELERLKEFYGNNVKGYYSKTTTSQNTILQLLKEKLTEKDQLSNNLYAISTKEICKIIRESTGGKGVKMGLVTNKKKSESDDDSDNGDNADHGEQNEDSEEDSEEEVVKQTKVKEVKEKKPTKKEEVKEKKPTKKEEVKEIMPIKETKVKETKQVKQKKTKPVKDEGEISLKNKTVIMLSDSEDDPEEDA